MIQQFRKKPVVISAVQYTGKNQAEIASFVGPNLWIQRGMPVIETEEGTMSISLGDWIIQGISNEFYPCKDFVFKETYDAA